MAEPFIAEIKMFGGNFAPRGWAFCDGQLLSVAQNAALFSLLGTTYGGDGRTTFGLPDLRGRVPIHPGDGPGRTNRRLGESGGKETVALPSKEIRTTGGVRGGRGERSTPLPTQANKENVAPGGQDQENMPPFLAVNFIIALQGLFPSRN